MPTQIAALPGLPDGGNRYPGSWWNSASFVSSLPNNLTLSGSYTLSWNKRKYDEFYLSLIHILNVSDDDAEKYIKIFTDLDKETIDALVEEHKQDPGRRVLPVSYTHLLLLNH